jgi:hypothetical protein
MRPNKYGVRGLKGVQLKRGFIYFWTLSSHFKKVAYLNTKHLVPILSLDLDHSDF